MWLHLGPPRLSHHLKVLHLITFAYHTLMGWHSRFQWLWPARLQMCPPHPPNLYVASFLSKFMYFNWGLITLQYCIGFAIHQHESTMGAHVFPILNAPPSPYHPSGSSQCTSPEHPVLCIEPGLAIHFTYDIIHVSVPFSQIIPLSPSPTESKRLFYTSVSLLLKHFF